MVQVCWLNASKLPPILRPFPVLAAVGFPLRAFLIKGASIVVGSAIPDLLGLKLHPLQAGVIH